MNASQTLIAVLLMLGLFNSPWAGAFSQYDDPFLLGTYVTHPDEPIKAGMAQYHWTVAAEEPGKILALLNYKGHEIKLNIYYNAEKIWFEQISARKLECTKHCEFKQRYLTNWRTGLRRGIAYQLTLLAQQDARQKAANAK